MSLPGFTGAMATTGEPGFAAGGMDPHRALAVATATGTPLYSCFARRGIYPPNNQAPGSGIRRAAAACMRLSVLLQLKRQRRRHCPPAGFFFSLVAQPGEM